MVCNQGLKGRLVIAQGKALGLGGKHKNPVGFSAIGRDDQEYYPVIHCGDKKIINKKVGIKNITKEGKEFNFGFISGLIDSDGYVGPDRTSIRILICSYFESIIQETHKILKNLGLISYIQFDNKRNCWILRISTPYFRQNYSNIKCIKGSWSIGKTLPSQIPEQAETSGSIPDESILFEIHSPPVHKGSEPIRVQSSRFNIRQIFVLYN